MTLSYKRKLRNRAKTIYFKLLALSKIEEDERIVKARKLVAEFVKDATYDIQNHMPDRTIIKRRR